MLPSAASVSKCNQYNFIQLMSRILLSHSFQSIHYCSMCQSPTIYYLHRTVYLSCILLCNCNKCLFISEIASKTESTRETVYHTRQLSRMLMKKGKAPKLGKLDETNQPVIGTFFFLWLISAPCLVYFYRILQSYTCY